MRTLADALLAALPRKLPARTHLHLALAIAAYEPRFTRVVRAEKRLLAAMLELSDAQEELGLAADLVDLGLEAYLLAHREAARLAGWIEERRETPQHDERTDGEREFDEADATWFEERDRRRAERPLASTERSAA